ncbi:MULTISPECIES: 2-amino-4-hydroxy-6-hydroxymethyldihydropteridine diphosphokinase [Pacificimonas]|nr:MULTISPECIES: 2-amino-4-hydroxy-6-hydroxymethyldihydropteridine diphosphokinase [Pacificimonas]MBZ6379805.1 2-amino-4-hydroxy-6-hydroxymethyldihydropteridine diphosphokinase [Pacificimonas aurantium]
MTILIALGSNRRHGRHGTPGRVLRAALAALQQSGGHDIGVTAASSVWITPALGPGGRTYANMAAALETALPPEELLARLHEVEAAFGRRRYRRWGARVLDLDLLAYGEAVRPSRHRWPGTRTRVRAASRALVLPHPEMHRRAFVLGPLLGIAPDWRHPVLGLTVRQMSARLRRPRVSVG